MFRGRYEHQIDAKGRLSVPSRFRDVLASASDGKLIITNFDECLWAFALPEWAELERKVAALPQFMDEVKALQRVFISAAVECPIDRQGRILIPPTLREYAGLLRDVVVVGMTRRFEVWAKERWDAVFAHARVKLDGMGAKLAELGL
jgi:MraZ protein